MYTTFKRYLSTQIHRYREQNSGWQRLGQEEIIDQWI